MKRILIFMTALVCSLSIRAQKLELSLNGGIASPMGNFSKADYSNEASGFARTGGSFHADGTWFFNSHFGIAALIGYSRFGVKGSQSLADGYKEDSGTDSTTLYLKGSNHVWSFLAGTVYRINAGKKITLTARVLAGYAQTHLAGFQIFYEDYLDNAMSQRETSGGALALQGGLGVQYHLSKKVLVQVNGDYFTSKPDIAIRYDNFVVNSGRRLSRYHESISVIHATAGIAYTLF